MLLSWNSFLTLLLCFVGRQVTFALQDVTSDLFGSENYGTVAAFGDFNSDKQTDIFIIREQSELLIFLADLKAPYFKPKVHLTKEVFPRDSISSVVPGDYDGDSQMDVLITAHPKGSGPLETTVYIFWGHNQTLNQSARLDLNKTFKDEPLVMDFNGDMIPDIFGVEGESLVVCYLSTRKQRCEKALGSNVNMRVPHSNAFIDLNKDFTDGNFTQMQPGKAPDEAKKVGQSAFVDFGELKHISWVPVLTDFQRKDSLWGFVPPPDSPAVRELHSPITLHLGDYNLDGFPDALGILDMIVLSKVEGKEELIIHALKNNFEVDAYFVKVIVLSGLCSNDCPEKVKPFGVNQPGPYVMYTSVDSNGYLKNASAGQLSQSAHLSLQLPYTVLGLGRSANFLDHLFVGIPRPLGVKDMRKQEWTAIIPNSQLIVIPYPQNDPRSWSAKLYLTPSNIVLLTAIALIGVCVFILVIIGILHWKEKKADDREKRQEAHRFHFDAM
ncbi:putative T-cell immunomodulatory protein [Triplophysa rosa]|uniref:T-cell immunomodulatory protein n=1 Tax=Triplophysa rosa TaxID=992332 RepID=A0A9W7X4T0_TRIRA|nr:putative T-cell immunomodulatory protein [Triplophysa rosa]